MGILMGILVGIGIFAFAICWNFLAKVERQGNEKETKEIKEQCIKNKVFENIKNQADKAVEKQISEATYRKVDLIIKAIIAFILLCMLFASCGIQEAIEGVYSGETIRVINSNW